MISSNFRRVVYLGILLLILLIIQGADYQIVVELKQLLLAVVELKQLIEMQQNIPSQKSFNSTIRNNLMQTSLLKNHSNQQLDVSGNQTSI